MHGARSDILKNPGAAVGRQNPRARNLGTAWALCFDAGALMLNGFAHAGAKSKRATEYAPIGKTVSRRHI